MTVTFAYYWLLISKITVLENQNKVFKSQLKISQDLMHTLSRTGDGVGSYYFNKSVPKPKNGLCETIHVAFVCMHKCTRYVIPMLKSLLYHRQNPIHFHIMVDDQSEISTKTLFDSWDLPDVKYKCYNVVNKMSAVDWIPNSHYSGVYTLVKLILPDILPETLDKVIVLDGDLTFLSDVAELWKMFKNMTNEQFIGLVENESNWYFGSNTNRWPALGRGFNTGVILLNLAMMRTKINWSRTWHEAVNENIIELKQTMLADQDVVNAVIKKNPHIVYNISCEYNVQLSTQTLSKNCYGTDFGKVKVLHWNSPSKYKINLKDAPFFRSIHQMYVDLNGNLLRNKLELCSESVSSAPKFNDSDVCHTFRSAQTIKLRTHLYYMDFSYDYQDAFDVTLVLQLSMDRLQFLERLVKFWEGPLSAAIYLSDCELTQFENFINDWSETLNSRRNIGYHLVFTNDALHYPVNYLRNVALQHIVTPYAFLMDVDFVPMAGLYQHLCRALQLINPAPSKKVLVVAAFESQRYRVHPPRSKAALKTRLLSGGDVAPFRGHEWPQGHRATNYSRWLTATAPYEVEWQPDYEPYLVVHRSIPKYDTRFSGFGWNKVSHSVELRAQGYRPVVLPGAFVVHAPHAPSADITMFRVSPHYRICLAILKQEFMDDLKRKYNVTFEEAPPKSEPISNLIPNG